MWLWPTNKCYLVFAGTKYMLYVPITGAFKLQVYTCFKLVLFMSVMVIVVIVHDDVFKWKHFPRYWPFVRGIHRPPVNSTHKGQWRGALMFSLICAWINTWVNNREAGDLRRYQVNYDVALMNSGFTNDNHITKYHHNKNHGRRYRAKIAI